MGFSVNSFAKIWEVKKTTDKSTQAQISITKRNKETGSYETTFMAHAYFLGNAHRNKPQQGQKIRILSCDVTNECYVNAEGEKTYPIKFIIYDYVLANSASISDGTNNNGVKAEQDNTKAIKMAELSDDDLPF